MTTLYRHEMAEISYCKKCLEVINAALGWYLIRQGKNITPLSLKPMVKMLHFKCLKFSGISLPKVRRGNSRVNDEKNIKN